jgi:hypothetical protein
LSPSSSADEAPQDVPFPLVFTVKSFCESHHISRSLLYELLGEGCGPRIMKVGKRTLITAEAAAEWRQRMEAGTLESKAGENRE